MIRELQSLALNVELLDEQRELAARRAKRKIFSASLKNLKTHSGLMPFEFPWRPPT
jgi:hypothetical protein